MSQETSTSPAKIALDIGVAMTLALALVVVCVADRLVFGVADEPEPITVTETDPTTPSTSEPKPLRIAVTTAQLDDVGSLLDKLGEGYEYQTIDVDVMRDDAALAEYDVVFLTCGSVPRSWLTRQIGVNARGMGIFAPDAGVVAQLKESIRGFVGRGGTLYVSDLMFNVISLVFEEYIDKSILALGEPQDVRADVVDEGLREVLGQNLALRFDQPGWISAGFRADKSTRYLVGTFRSSDGRNVTAPLLVKFSHEKGTVVYTSFHNEKQNDAKELELLRYLVFATVTAREESRVRETLVQGGFSPRKSNLLSASSDTMSVTKVYQCAGAGQLTFALGFEDRGARLRMRVKGPGGVEEEKEGTSTFSIEVPDAQPGRWEYTVTALEVPYANFPFTLTVGVK